jgi:predicted dehydrogenase
MEHRKLRVGFIGAGANTRLTHIPGFHKLENVVLSVVANRSRASAEKVAKQDGIQRVVDTWQEVVSDSSLDAICIGTWPNMHAALTIAALQSGKHVLCEARMACNLKEALHMQTVAQAHPELVAQLVPAPFSLDFDVKIREMIATGELGELLEVRVVHTGGQSASPNAAMTWRQDRNFSGNNILTMGIIHETIQRWVADAPEWLMADGAVFQSMRRYAGATEPSQAEVPESLSVWGRFQQSRARLVYHFSGVESGKPRMEFRLNGSKGALRFDAFQKQLLFSQAGSTEETKITISRGQSRGWQVESDFVQSIRTHMPVELTSFDQGVHYMAFTEMVNESLGNQSARVSWPL